MEQRIIRGLLVLAAGTVFFPLMFGCATAPPKPPSASIARFSSAPMPGGLFLCQLKGAEEHHFLDCDAVEVKASAPNQL